MLLWMGLFLIALGVACVAIDRPATHFIYDHVGVRFDNFLSVTTHLARAATWLAAACLVFALTWHGCAGSGRVPASADLAGGARLYRQPRAGSVALHGIKLVLGRKRPRDELR